MLYGSTRPGKKPDSNEPLTCALSVRIQEDDMMFLKKSADANCRTLADEVRYIIKAAKRRANSAKITTAPS